MEVLVLNSEAKKQTILGYVFLIPSLAVFAVFMFYPLFYTFYLSFFEWNMVKPVKKFVGLANYISVFKDDLYRDPVGIQLCDAVHSLIYSFLCD